VVAPVILTGAMVIAGPGSGKVREVRIHGPRKLDLAGHVLLPGLVNAHDHLEFNLFPRLGNGPYRNAGDWARDIYHPGRSPIREQLRVPKHVRLWWGGLKNLLSGVTTVCHHNPYEPKVFGRDFPVRVVRTFAWAHSVEYAPDCLDRFWKAPKGYPWLVHCGEGTGAGARDELDTLDFGGALDERTAIIHGVAFGPKELDLMRQRGASLIWCPSSNLAMLGRTVSRGILRSEIPIALGTDSALSAPVDLIEELGVARKYLPASDREKRLYEMVSSVPAKILHLTPRDTAGDWVAVRSEAASPLEALTGGSIALVVVRGHIRLIAPALAQQVPPHVAGRFRPLTIEGRPTVLVDANIRELRRAAGEHLGPTFRLAGKRILE
jgi:cytosine/adenosine deaminase-related metal-dependent hydrolase